MGLCATPHVPITAGRWPFGVLCVQRSETASQAWFAAVGGIEGAISVHKKKPLANQRLFKTSLEAEVITSWLLQQRPWPVQQRLQRPWQRR